jgi:hypothetical protein
MMFSVGEHDRSRGGGELVRCRLSQEHLFMGQSIAKTAAIRAKTTLGFGSANHR